MKLVMALWESRQPSPFTVPAFILKSEIYTVDHCWLEGMPGRIRKTEDVFKILKFLPPETNLWQKTRHDKHTVAQPYVIFLQLVLCNAFRFRGHLALAALLFLFAFQSTFTKHGLWWRRWS